MRIRLNINLNLKKSIATGINYREYCARALYPAPYERQVDMYKFAFHPDSKTPRELLAARKYGKTDYITICGSGYEILKNPQYKILLITKENERGKEIVAEIRETLKRNGVRFASKAKTKIRVAGCRGKEFNLTALTIRSRGLRGRHPDLVIMEDPITPDDASETERLRVKKVYEEVLKLTQNVCIIGQPVHNDDLYNELRGKISTMEVWHGAIPELDVDLDIERAAGVSEESIQASYFGKVIGDGGQPFHDIERVGYFAPKNRRKLESIGKQIRQHLLHLIRINPKGECTHLMLKLISNIPALSQRVKTTFDFSSEPNELRAADPKSHLVELNLAEIQQLLDHSSQPLGILLDDSYVIGKSSLWGILLHLVDRTKDERERGFHLMRDIGEEFKALGCHLLDLPFGFSQLLPLLTHESITFTE